MALDDFPHRGPVAAWEDVIAELVANGAFHEPPERSRCSADLRHDDRGDDRPQRCTARHIDRTWPGVPRNAYGGGRPALRFDHIGADPF